jgi:hypothetical protein
MSIAYNSNISFLIFPIKFLQQQDLRGQWKILKYQVLRILAQWYIQASEKCNFLKELVQSSLIKIIRVKDSKLRTTSLSIIIPLHPILMNINLMLHRNKQNQTEHYHPSMLRIKKIQRLKMILIHIEKTKSNQ